MVPAWEAIAAGNAPQGASNTAADRLAAWNLPLRDGL